MSKRAIIIKCNKCGAIGMAKDGLFYCNEHRLVCRGCGEIVNAKAIMRIRGSVYGPVIPKWPSPFRFYLGDLLARIRFKINQARLRREYQRRGPSQSDTLPAAATSPAEQKGSP